jgi:alpha-galactosidase
MSKHSKSYYFRKLRLVTNAALFFLGLSTHCVVGQTVTRDASIGTAWPAEQDQPFYASIRPGIGFSFTYAGRQVGPNDLTGWTVNSSNDVTTLRNKSGFTVIRETRRYSDFGALEYKVRFRNDGPSAAEPVSLVNTMDLEFDGSVLPGSSIVSSGGGGFDGTYPPQTYQIKKHLFGPTSLENGEVVLGSKGGRSSSLDFPFYFIDNVEKKAGLFVGIGWSGQWSAKISADFKDNVLRLTAGMPDERIRLRPGEEISGPSILIGCYRGAISDGSNRLRRLIRERIARQSPALPVLLYDSWFNIGVAFDEALLHREADAARALGLEYFLLDAGWYTGTTAPYHFSEGVGNWESVDGTKLPSGLGALADYVRSKDLKFGLWFEPERVARGTIVARKHPDWILWSPSDSYGLLDFGRPDVQAYVETLLDRYIQELGLKYIRWDFNFSPLQDWTNHDSPDRMGITQIRYIEGVYSVSDWLRKRHPETLVEDCASGGNRIDFEMMRRRDTFWISDETMDPAIVRFHLEGLNWFMSGAPQMVSFTLPTPWHKDYDLPDINFQSFFGGAFGFAGRIDEWPGTFLDRARKNVEVFKKLRGFLDGDYYPLLPQAQDLAAWSAWQFDAPDKGEGFVQVFRLRSSAPSKVIQMKALEAGASYRLEDPYTGEIKIVSGAELLRGLNVPLDEMTSKVLIYKRVTGE